MRSSVLRGLVAGLALSSAAGCAATPVPSSLADAQRALDRPETSDLEALQPELIGDARAAEQRGMEHWRSGEETPAGLEGTIAVAKIRTAENLVREEEARTRGERGVPAQPREPARPKAAPARRRTPPRKAEATATSATRPDAALARAMDDAEDARSDAIGRGAATDPGMAHADAMLDVARLAVARGDVSRAIERAKDARRVFGLLRTAVAQAPVPQPPAAPSPPEPRRPAPAPSAPTASSAPSAPMTANKDPRKEEAAALVLEAQRAQADLSSRLGEDKRLKKASTLVRAAEQWLALADYPRAKAVAQDARVEQRAVDLATKNGAGEAAKPQPPSTSTAAPTAPPATPAATGRACDDAGQAIARAQAATGAATATPGPRLEAARALLRNAEDLRRAGSCTQAAALADDARRQAETRDAAPPATPVAARTPTTTPVAEPKREATPPAKAEPARTEAATAARADRVVAAYRDSGGKASGWEEPYRTTLEALALRDEAKPLAKGPLAATFARGDEALGRARAAYRSKQYPVATSFATTARAAFQQVIAAATPIAAEEAVADDGSPAFKAADAALREASVLYELCEKEGCAERELRTFLQGKEALSSARRAFAGQRHLDAKRLASEAAAAFDTALTKPSGRKPANVDKAAQQGAEDALREAQVQVQLCEAARCNDRSLEAWLRASSLLSASKASFADQEFARARDQALEAKGLLEKANAAKGLLVPPGITRVRVEGDRIVADPPLDFRTGSAQLTPAGQDALREVVRVLQANRDRIAGIDVVGFTDSRGNPALNRQISASRAKSVAQALGDSGVPRDAITSEGRGADQPIADNATDEGRKRNRRVDILVRLK